MHGAEWLERADTATGRSAAQSKRPDPSQRITNAGSRIETATLSNAATPRPRQLGPEPATTPPPIDQLVNTPVISDYYEAPPAHAISPLVPRPHAAAVTRRSASAIG